MNVEVDVHGLAFCLGVGSLKVVRCAVVHTSGFEITSGCTRRIGHEGRHEEDGVFSSAVDEAIPLSETKAEAPIRHDTM